MKANIMKMERGIRLAAGGALVLGVLTNPFSPAWLALIGAYSTLTAIICWDPAYAAARALFGGERKPARVLPRPVRFNTIAR